MQFNDHHLGQVMSFNLSTSIQRFGLAAAGTAIATLGSIGSAQAFSVTELSAANGLPNLVDAGQTVNTARTLPTPDPNNSITGAILANGTIVSGVRREDGADLYRFVVSSLNQLFTASVAPTGSFSGSISFGSFNVNVPTINVGLTDPRIYLFRALNSGQVERVAGGANAISQTLITAGTYFLGIAGPNYVPTFGNGASGVLGWTGTRTTGAYIANFNLAPAPNPVPEPFTMLGGAAALGVGGMMQRKRKKRQLVAQKVD